MSDLQSAVKRLRELDAAETDGPWYGAGMNVAANITLVADLQKNDKYADVRLIATARNILLEVAALLEAVSSQGSEINPIVRLAALAKITRAAEALAAKIGGAA